MLPYKKLLLRRNAFFRQQLSMQQLDSSQLTDHLDPLLETSSEGHSATLHPHTEDASFSNATIALQHLSR